MTNWNQNAERLESLRKKSLTDLYFFCKHILNYEEIEEQPHRELCDFVTEGKSPKRLILMPRGSFKSSVITMGFSLWRLLNNPNLRILISSETFAQSKMFLKGIKNHIETNETLKLLFGDLKGQDSVWRADEITITGKTSTKTKEPSIAVSGVGVAKVGQHYDLIILDDVVSNNNITTIDQVNKVIDHYKLLLSILDPGGEIIIIGCLVGDSNILMADGTYKHIKDISVGEYVWSVDKNLKLQKKKVLNVIPQGAAKVVEVKTTRDSIKCTANHPFLVIDGNKRDWKHVWKKAEELKENDVLVTGKHLNLDYRKRILDNNQIDCEMAWFLGYIVGDGWYNKNGSSYYLSIAKSEYSLLDEKIKSLMENYFNATVHDTKYGYYRITSKKVKFLEKLGFKKGAKNKDMPEWLFKCRASIKRAFLEGLIDADGCKEKNGFGYAIEVSSKKLIEDIKKISQTCSVRTSNIYKRTRMIKAPNSKKEVESTTYHTHLVFEHASLIKNKNIYKNFPQHGLRMEKVISVKPMTIEEPVYDLTIDDNENFIANGFVVHNTRYSFADLYGHILEYEKDAYDILHRAAINKDGSLYFPTRLTHDFLSQQRKSQGSQIFSNQYMNQCVDEDSAMFKERWLKYYKELPQGLRYFMTIDPAGSDAKRADFNGIIVAGIDAENNIYVKEAIKQKGTILQTLDLVFELVAKYNIDTEGTVGLEVAAMQQTLKFVFTEEMNKRKFFFTIQELKPHTNKSKVNRVRALQPYFENGKIYYHRDMFDLIDETLRFPRGKHDDLIDSLAYMLEIMLPGDNVVAEKWKDTKLTKNELAVWKQLDELKKRSVKRTKVRF